jgi:hypothetical protein
MRRIVMVGAFVGVALTVRARIPTLQQRLVAHCEGMFERMPDTFPPKRVLSGIEEIRVTTARILELLETGTEKRGEAEEVHQAA